MVQRPRNEEGLGNDILLMFRDASNCERYALHIENKTAHRKWEPNQAENYRKRATNRMKAWRYVDFQTILLAPSAFVCRHPAEATSFDVVLLYEDVGAFVPEFATAASVVASLNPN
jgi:hypothetical protein